MTSKRIKKKKKTSKFVALLLLFKNREKELYPKTNDIQNTRRVLSRGSYPLQKKREREKQTRRWLLSFHKSFSCEKKIPLSHDMKRKHNKQQAKKKKKKKTTKQTDDWLLLRKTETLYTHFGGFIFIRKKSSCSCSLLLRSRRDQVVFFPGGDFRNE